MQDLNTRIIITGQDRASEVWRKVGLEAEGAKRRLLDFNHVGGGLVGGLALGAAVRAIDQQFSAYEQSLADMGNLTDEEVSRIAERIKSLGPELGSSRELVAGYYQTVSAGVKDPAAALETLAGAAKAAKAGHVTQDEMVRVSTKLLKGYGGEIRDVTDATDLLFAVEKEGQTTVRELVPYMGELANISREVGVSAEEMGAGLATITLTAGDTASAATQYKAVLLALYKPQEQMTQALDSMGYKSGVAMVQELGLAGALAKVRDYAQRAGIPLGKLVESKEALIGFAALANNGFADFNERLASMEQRAGATDRAFHRWEATWAGVKDTFENTVGNVLVELGEELAPRAKQRMQELTDYLNKPETREGIAELGQTAGDFAENLAKAGVTGVNILKDIADGWNMLPPLVQQVGLFSALFFGAKGMAVLGMGSLLVEETNRVIEMAKMQARGELSLSEFTFSFESLDELKRRTGSVEGMEKTLERLRKKQSGTIWAGEKEDYARQIAELEQKLQAKRAQQASDPHRLLRDVDPSLLARKAAGAAKPDAPPVDAALSKEAAKALEKVNAEIAKLTLTPHDLALFELNQQVADLTKLLGANHPRLKEYVELRKQAIEADVMSDPLFRDAYNKAQRGTTAQRLLHDVDADAVREAQASSFKELHERDLQVLTDFDKEYRRVIQGETEFQLEQVDAQARVWREAGADEVRVAQWVAEEKKKLLAHTSSDYAAGWSSGMDQVVKDTKSGYQLMESLSQSTFSSMGDAFGDLFYDSVTGKLKDLGDYVTSFFNAVLRSMSQLYGQQMAGGLASGLSGWLGSSSGSLTASQRSQMLSNYSSTGSIARAEGGWIDEPVLGVGLASGRTWTFGERGEREMVTPESKLGGRGTYHITQHYHISTGVADTVRKEVRAAAPAIQAATISAIDSRNRRGGRK